MITPFTKEIAGTSFEFVPVNVSRPQLFQVYVGEGAGRIRFHLQLAGDRYEIPDRDRCPRQYLDIEEEFSLAVLAQYPPQ